MVQAGQKVRASDVLGWQYVKKSATQSFTSNVTPANLTDLSISLTVGKWLVLARLAVTGVSGGDVRLVWTTTGTISFLSRSCAGPGATTADVADGSLQSTGRSGTTEVVYGLTSTTTAGKVFEELLLDCTVAGTLQLQGAQGTSNGTATVFGTSCHLLWIPVTAA